MKTALAACVLTGALLSTASLTAGVLVQDSFSRIGALTGSMADIGSGTWTGNVTGGYTTDGTDASVATGDWQNYAVFPLAGITLPTSGLLSLSATVTSASNDSGDHWMAIGFFTGGGNNFLSNGSHWILQRTNGGYQAFNGGGTAGQVVNYTNPSPALSTTATVEVLINLDTNSVEYRSNGSLLGSSAYVAPSGGFTGIGFGNYESQTGAFTVDNFTLGTTAIPEPSTYGALAGVLGLALVAWRRRR